MTITSVKAFRRLAVVPTIILAAFMPLAAASAGQSATPPTTQVRPYVPPPSVQYQQAVQQQQVRDQLRKSELQQQLQQSVSDNAKRPGANNPQLQRQLDQADQARHDRDRAALKALLDRQQTLPRVIPPDAPTSSRSGG